MHCDCSKAVREATAPLLATIAELRDALSEARQANAELSKRALSGDPTVFGRCMPIRDGDDYPIAPGEQWP